MNRECCMVHFSQLYFGSDAAQPPEVDSKFVEKTVISTKYDLGKRCHFLVSKTKIVKKSMLRSIGSDREALIHHGFVYIRLHSQILEHSELFLGDIGLSH